MRFLELDRVALLRSIASSGVARGGGALANLGFSVSVGRLLGAEATGTFFVSLTVLTLSSQLTRYGFPFYILHKGSDDSTVLPSVYGNAIIRVLVVSAVTGFCLALVRVPVADLLGWAPQQAGVLALLAVALLPFTGIWVNAGAMKAMGSPEQANLAESAWIPATATVLLWVFRPVTSSHALTLYAIGCFVVFLGTTAFLVRRFGGLPSVVKNVRIRAQVIDGAWRYGSGATAVAIVNFLVLWLPFLMLGRSATAEAVGAYGAAQRIVMMISLVNVVVNSVYLPRFAAGYRRRQAGRLRRDLLITGAVMVLVSAPLAVTALFIPRNLLGLFGPDFEAGVAALQILTICFLISMVFGPTDEILLMFGRSGTLTGLSAVVLVIVVLASLLAIPSGVDRAAAWTVGGSLVAKRAIAWLVVRREIRMLQERVA